MPDERLRPANSPGPEPAAARASSRRRFLKQATAGVAVVAAGGVAGSAAALSAAAGPALAADLEGERRRFLSQARASLGTQSATAEGIVGDLSETALANLSDPTGQRGSKLLGAAPWRAPGDAPAAAGAIPGESILLRMQRDLQRALAKPVEERRWAMVIDLRKCIGCSACTVACKAENKLPPGVVYRPVIEEEVGEYPNVSRRFIPRPCMQCDNPPCVSVCPVAATYKRPDGIVEIDYNVCIGCRYCIAACPYGARTFDWGANYTDQTPERQPYELVAAHEYGQSWSRQNGASPVGNARKCQFCLHRVAVGMLPACTTTCVGGATYFGDANDPTSLVAELMSRPNAMRLKEELGTRPKVHYLT